MARAGALKLVTPQQLEEPPGDPDLTRQHVGGLSDGQKRCRTRGFHNWRKFQDRVYGPDANRPGTRITRIQRCPDCLNRRERDFVVVSLGKDSRGLRKLDDHWHLVYVEVRGKDGEMHPYLLPRGAQRVTEDLRELLLAEEFYATDKGVVYVDDEGDEY